MILGRQPYCMENKKIVFINIGNYGSTGKIVEGLAEISEKEGYEVLKCYPKSSISGGKKKNDSEDCSAGKGAAKPDHLSATPGPIW